MATAKPGGFDKAGFIAAVKAAIAAQAPKNLEEAEDFGKSGKAEGVKAQVAGRVTEGKAASAKDIAETTEATPDASKAVEKPVTPLKTEPPPPGPKVDPAAGMPARAPAEQTDLSAGKRDTNAALAEADVTEQQLAKSNEPEFTQALAAKKEGEQHSASAPAAFREQEAAVLSGAGKAANATGAANLAGMLNAKKASQAKAAGGKDAAKVKEEQERARITGEIKAIFDATKKDVTGILTALDGIVAKQFSEGEQKVRAAFTADLNGRMERYKDARYSGITGAARWLSDKVGSMPKEADQIYVASRAGYERDMERLIGQVADTIGRELTRAKDRIAKGRADIKAYVASQPKALQKIAQGAAGQFEEQFDQLENDVDSKKDALVDDLATKYTESKTAVDEQITAMQDENKGLWDKAKDAVGGAIRTVLQLKEMLLSVLARAAAAVGKIIKDPIAFLGNLVNAVKGGILGFLERVGQHLKAGLQAWLLGALAEGGIELPAKFDLRGILTLVLSMLGLTWASIRARIVKKIPEKVMSGVEKAAGFIQIILKEGVGGLWKWVVEKVGDIKQMVMGKIREFVITKIVTAGITWLISLLNPAAAFIKACKMIYDAVMFFVEKASQIKEFVDSILDSVESIASGGFGAVAGYIEKTLAKMVPVLLGFLASLLGLGGISEKIKSILETIQKPVGKVIDSLVAGAVRIGKGLLKKLGGMFSRKGKGKAAESPGEKDHRLKEALSHASKMMRPDMSPADAKKLLHEVKRRYSLTEAVLRADGGGQFHAELAINPRGSTKPQPLGGDTKVIAELRGMGLSDAAIRRVAEKRNADHIKGQLLEELVETKMLAALGVDTKGASLIPGHRIRDASGKSLTDGMLVIRSGDKARLLAFVEVKSGRSAARELTSVREDHDEEELLANAIDTLKEEQPKLAGRTQAQLRQTHMKTLQNIIRKQYPKTESGQLRKGTERLDPNVGTTFTPILIDGKRMKLVGASASTLKVVVLTTDVVLPRMTKEKLREVHGVLNVEKVNLGLPVRKLSALAKRIAKANIT